MYPAFTAIRYDALARLKGSGRLSRFRPSHIQFGFRQTVTCVQFVITIALLASALIIYRQLQYMQETNLGFTKDHLLAITNPYDDGMYSRYEHFKSTAGQHPQVLSVSAGGNVPSENINNYTQAWVRNKKQGDGIHCAQIAVDYDFFATLQAKFVAGRDFSREHPSDQDGESSLPVKAARALGLQNPVGTEVSGINNASDPQRILGVIDDIHFRSFREEVPPVLFYLRPWSAVTIVLRLNGDVNRRNNGIS